MNLYMLAFKHHILVFWAAIFTLLAWVVRITYWAVKIIGMVLLTVITAPFIFWDWVESKRKDRPQLSQELIDKVMYIAELKASMPFNQRGLLTQFGFGCSVHTQDDEVYYQVGSLWRAKLRFTVKSDGSISVDKYIQGNWEQKLEPTYQLAKSWSLQNESRGEPNESDDDYPIERIDLAQNDYDTLWRIAADDFSNSDLKRILSTRLHNDSKGSFLRLPYYETDIIAGAVKRSYERTCDENKKWLEDFEKDAGSSEKEIGDSALIKVLSHTGRWFAESEGLMSFWERIQYQRGPEEFHPFGKRN